MISINTTENNDNHGRYFKLLYVFVMSKVSVHSYVCHVLSLESTKNFCTKV